MRPATHRTIKTHADRRDYHKRDTLSHHSTVCQYSYVLRPNLLRMITLEAGGVQKGDQVFTCDAPFLIELGPGTRICMCTSVNVIETSRHRFVFKCLRRPPVPPWQRYKLSLKYPSRIICSVPRQTHKMALHSKYHIQGNGSRMIHRQISDPFLA